MSGSDDKRFDATPARRARAKREGNAARSAEVTSIAAFGAALLAAIASVPLAAAAALTVIRQTALHPVASGTFAASAGQVGTIAAVAGSLASARRIDADTIATTTDPLAVISIAALPLGAGAAAALVPMLAAACAGAVTALAQSGGLHVTPPRADLKRLDPFAGLKHMFGGEAVIAIVRAALAFAAALLAMIPLARDVLAGGAALGTPAAAAQLVALAALRACGAALVVGAVFAVADYALARRRWLRGLKMSFEELRRDAKENDGDPQARSRRKSAHRAVVRGTVGRTREASFVVVNPTHVAVALRYAPPAVAVPEILVRALDDAALRVRTIAAVHGIPVVEDVALARLLYAHGESGRAIPPDAYVAVAQVIAALAREGALS